MNYKQFVAEHKIRISSEWADANPNWPDSKDMNHYKVTMRMGKKQMTLHYSMGYAHTGEPKVDDVLSCLASDSASIENARSFEDWAGEFGYDTDSRKAERVYKTCERQAKKLKTFLGEELYNSLLWDTCED